MWLERIDPRLPSKVSITFAHQMVGNTSLRDLQPTICSRIPSLLQELDDTAANRAALHAVTSAADQDDDPVVAAFNVRGRGRNRGRTTFPRGNLPSGKFCRICFLTNRGSPQAYTSHTIMTCNKLSDRDKQEMVRHAALTLDEPEDTETPTPIVGWDIEEQ